MPPFDPTTYGPTVLSLLSPEPLCALGPGRPDETKRSILGSLEAQTLFGLTPAADLEMARCCLAGLWLLHDFLDESHGLSQEIGTTSGSYWHGIMHRREPDYGNAKYWFRRVGRHAVYAPLQEAARETAESVFVSSEVPAAAAHFVKAADWEPFHFVDLCERAAQNEALERFCRLVARAEWRLLFDYCYRRSIG